MIQDTVNSLRLTLSERLGNPFLSSALISCLVLNWQLTLLLFAPLTYDERVAKIYELYPDLQSASIELITKPVTLGLAWFFMWPAICWALNAYWYRMKARITNSKLSAERRRMVSESEAAQLYATIDQQEGKYLDLLRVRQEQKDKLLLELENRESALARTEELLNEQKVAHEKLTQEASTLQAKLQTANQDSDKQRYQLEEIAKLAVSFSGSLPGVKPITKFLKYEHDYRAKEVWVVDQLTASPIPGYTHVEAQKWIDFLVALGLLDRDRERNLSFSEAFRHKMNEVLGMYPNSPELS